MLNLAYSIRTKHHLKQICSINDMGYIPHIYMKNKNWNPPPASETIKNQLTVFEKALKNMHNSLNLKYQTRNLTNLTPIQTKMLKIFKQRTDIFITPTDKI